MDLLANRRDLCAIAAGVLLAASAAAFGDVIEPRDAAVPEAEGGGSRFEESVRTAFRNAGERAPGFRLGLSFPAAPDLAIAPPLELPSPAAAAKRPRIYWMAAAWLGTVAGSALNSFTDLPRAPQFHFTNEGFFGRHTYAGGGDKASHFVSYWGVARILTTVNLAAGAPADSAAVLGAVVSDFAGFVTELGDGTTHYGFSYEDFVLDTLGSATALAVYHYGLDDLIGFRFGPVPAPGTPSGNPYGGSGTDYSRLIFTGDLKIAGLARRSHFNPGPARFLLLSMTYGAKNYSYNAPESRERQIGVEIGLHVTEVLRALGVPEDRWWSKPIFLVLDLVRIPYTAIGIRYDLNHGKWRGPDIGGSARRQAF